MRLSVIIITKNEQDDLPRLLQSVAFSEELVVVDSGSSDQTLEIARRFGSKVYEEGWLGFGPQKNLALSHATCDWVLSMDADEWLPPETARKIERLTQSESDVNHAEGFFFPRQSFFMGRRIRWGDWRGDRVLRLFRRDSASFSNDLVHESVICVGRVRRLRQPIYHEPFKSIQELEEKSVRYNLLAAERLASAGRGGIVAALAHGFFTLIRGLVLRLGFLDGWPGLLVAWYNAKGTFRKYYWAGQLMRSEPSR